MDRISEIVLIVIGAIAIVGMGLLIWNEIKESRSTYNNNEEDKYGK